MSGFPVNALPTTRTHKPGKVPPPSFLCPQEAWAAALSWETRGWSCGGTRSCG